MLQGLDIPWGVMVDTWDLTFSSTSDVPDGLDLCPTVQAYHIEDKMLHLAIVSKYYTSVHTIYKFQHIFDYYNMFVQCVANGVFYFNNDIVFCSMLLEVNCYY